MLAANHFPFHRIFFFLYELSYVPEASLVCSKSNIGAVYCQNISPN